LIVNEVGFRTKGNVFSRVLPVIKEGDQIIAYQQVAFQLEFNATFDYESNSPEYTSLKSREVFDLEQLNFKHIRSYDYGAVTESVSYDLYREAGVITSNTSYTIVYFDIDGTVVPYGLFMLQEPIDDMMVERYFGKNNDDSIGDLYKCTWQTEPASLNENYFSYSLGISNYLEGYRKTYALKTNKGEEDFSAFTDFITEVNRITDATYYTYMQNYLDLDSFAKSLAMGFLIGSADDIRSNANNYYLYFNQGMAYYIPFDMDNALGYGWNPYGDYGLSLEIDSLQPSNWSGREPSEMVLIYRLLQDPEFITLYNQYLDQYTQPDGLFNYDMYLTEFQLVKSLYEEEIQSENHLGLTIFQLDLRNMQASTYYQEKIAEVRSQLNLFETT